MKNVLYICTEFSPGMIPYGSSIINAMAKSNRENIYAIVVSKGKYDYNNYIKEIYKSNVVFYNLKEDFISKLTSKIYPLKLINLIEKICQEKSINIIHFLTGDFILRTTILKYSKRFEVYYTVHDLEDHEISKKIGYIRRFQRWFIVRGNMKMLRKSTNLITNSEEQFELLKNNYLDKKIYFHNFPTLITDEIALGNQIMKETSTLKKYILFFGVVSLYKGIDILYNAFMSSSLIEDYYLVIAGKGELLFERNIKKENGRLIHINRFINNNEIAELYKNASCVVYPYNSATQSGVLSLSYFFQCPLLVSDVNYFKQNVVDNVTALVFRKGNVNNLKLKLEQLLFNTDLLSMQDEQKKIYEKKFSDLHLANQLTQIYNKN